MLGLGFGVWDLGMVVWGMEFWYFVFRDPDFGCGAYRVAALVGGLRINVEEGQEAHALHVHRHRHLHCVFGCLRVSVWVDWPACVVNWSAWVVDWTVVIRLC